MNAGAWIIIAILAVVLIAGLLMAWSFSQQRRSKRLRDEFGPEYYTTIAERGSRRSAEKELERRQERVEHLNIRPLPSEDQSRFAEAWRGTQARFVDDPPGAIVEADRLVAQVMQARGYPVTDFEQRAADISVNHPSVVSNYRAAHAIYEANERGEATTEDLRQAMVYYRDLFEELLEARESRRMEVR